MFGVALLTSALLALADARIYDRCELARDFYRLGVKRDSIATWVCIAFHESRFDTAARNPNSGDHGLLQISELFWCGPGKACGAPCSAFRDDDISDDIECALQIYEEHTRLQGDGFLAWVVYPHHCKHNAKKYLADCDVFLKDTSYKLEERGRYLKSQKLAHNETTPFYKKYPNIDDLKPPNIAINTLLRGTYNNNFEENFNFIKEKSDMNEYYSQDEKLPFKWLNTRILNDAPLPNIKIDNIDDLKPPVYGSGDIMKYTTPSTVTFIRTTAADPDLMRIKPPNPRRLETNQFRRRMMSFKNKYVQSNDLNNIMSSPPSIAKTSAAIVSPEITTKRPIINVERQSGIVSSFKITGFQNQVNNDSNHMRSTLTPYSISRISFNNIPSTGYVSPQVINISTTSSPVHSLLHKQEVFNQMNEEESSSTSVSNNSQKIKMENLSRNIDFNKVSSTTENIKYNLESTTKSSTNKIVFNERKISFTPLRYTELTTKYPRVTRPWITSRFSSEKSPPTEIYTTRPEISSSPAFSSTIQSGAAITERTTKTTQSIFDLYLKPTKRPNIMFRYPAFKDSPFKLRIFSGGTTTLSPFS